MDQVALAKDECAHNMKIGDLRTHVGYANCANERIWRLYKEIDYPDMGLIEKTNKRRLELAKQLDSGKISIRAVKSEMHDLETRIEIETGKTFDAPKGL